MRKSDEQIASHELEVTTAAVRQYAGSDCSRHVIAMLDALGKSYALDLLHVKPDGLLQLQSCMRQVFAIRNALADDGIDVPKI